MIHEPGTLDAAIVEDSIEFQDGAGNAVSSLSAGSTALIYVRDADLATAGSCTGTWINLGALVVAGTHWSLASGQPRPSEYSLDGSCAYDRTIPARTPLKLSPLPTAKVNNVPTLVTCCENSPDEVALLTNANAGSTLEVQFAFDVIDARTVPDQRARVISTSDTGGEWVAITEVATETNSAASPTSGLFRGEMLLDSNSSAAAGGDGAVWVRPGDTLTARYYQADSQGIIASDTAVISAAPPEPYS